MILKGTAAVLCSGDVSNKAKILMPNSIVKLKYVDSRVEFSRNARFLGTYNSGELGFDVSEELVSKEILLEAKNIIAIESEVPEICIS